jgi:cytochrome c-type biogenesis protein CcmH
MTALLILLFVLLALAAATFACWPLLRRREAGTVILAGAVAALVLGIGGGVYLWLGTPALALRTLTGPQDNDWKSAMAKLVANARAHPADATAWAMLGRGYFLIGDGTEAAAAFRRAAFLSAPAQQPALFSAQGEALVLAASGQVTPEAEAAFSAALQGDPKDLPARLYLGAVYAARHENARALALWQSLLADTPPDAPWRAGLIDRIAALGASSGQAPDIGAMVAGLAARLRAQPNDPQGWQRLVRAYVVLGDGAKANAALADARSALKKDPSAMAALTAEAKELKLQK